MRNMTAFYLACLWIMAALSGCITAKKIKYNEPVTFSHPMVEREFRAAWVATVVNIDWPSEPGLSTEQQKAEALAILDTAAALNLNALVFQVRPHCDAMYESKLEPWSYYLTGTQGKAPEPFYDPLEFWVEEAHNRGIELHAWFNPYRAHHPKGGEITETSIVKTHPGLVKAIDNNFFWMDPGLQATQNHSYQVVMDVVQRYDIDGVHFDDYFYPYGDGNFPDDEAWEAYQRAGGKLNRGDWRRDNVNRFIKRVYEGIKRTKAHVKFGLSPFGIYRPGHPPSIRGFDQYERLYADTKLWLHEGWLDYWSPQLYWPIKQIPQSFPVLLGYWVSENKKERNIWPGMFTSKVKNETSVEENINQIMITRGFVPNNPGHIHFSMKALTQNYGEILKDLKTGPYRKEALIPPSPWLDAEPPAPPVVNTKTETDSIQYFWQPRMDDVFRHVVYFKFGDFWDYKILNRNDNLIWLPKKLARTVNSKNESGEEISEEIFIPLSQVMVTAVDRLGNESSPAKFKVDSN